MNINQNLPGRPNVDCGVKMTTFTGKYVDPYDMSPDDLNIEDIAQGLSCMTRFAGQCRQFYSVAQHSVHCAQAVFKQTQNRKLARIALLHDAPEAFLCDLVRCVKLKLPDYQDAEYGIWLSVVLKFNLEPLVALVHDGTVEVDLPPEVRDADLRMLVTERRDLISDKSAVWDLEKTHDPYDFQVFPMEPKEARQFFIDHYKELFWSE